MSFEFTRRDFLKGVGAAAVAGAALAPAASGEEPDKPAAVALDRPLGPGPVAYTLHVNGKETKVALEPRVTLLDALRNRLDLTGAKPACDRGACGACTVLVDGTPMNACMLLAIDCRDRKIVTVEGLAAGEKLNPVQEEFCRHDALQCGFCTPGMVVSLTGFLSRVKNPTLDQIKAALAGNLCRCGTYHQIFQAAQAAAKKMGG